MYRPALLLVLFALGVSFCSTAFAADRVALVLPHAHSHNDYHQAKPLTDALAHGFCSIEADVFLIDGQLLVGHDPTELRPGRTLQALYLDPLRERVKRREGWVYDKNQPLTLLVDFKTSGAETYQALRKILPDYRDMLSSVKEGKCEQRAIDLVISGSRPQAEVAADAERYAFIDGRIKELNDQTPWQLVPLVSENWNSFFQWRGQGPMPEDEKEKLRRIVQQMHDQQRRLRFWATPETPKFWSELRDAGVDLIGTDDLDALQTFFTKPVAE